jgi:hypothetical protein
MAKKVRALTPAAARRIRAQIAAERELRERGIEPASQVQNGEWVQKWARQHISDTIGLRPDLLD